MSDHAATPAWIGPAPSLAQAVGVMTVGVMGVMIAGLQPLLLGALAQEGRLTAAQVGHAATAELLTMGLAAGLAGAWLKAERLKLIVLLAALVLAGLNAATVKVSGEMITLVRAAAGVPSGLMIWLAIGMISRAPRPERWSGIYLTVQTLAQFLLAAALTAWVVGRWGANGGFLALGAVGLACGLVGLASPDRYTPLAHESEAGGGRRMPLAGWVSLAAAFLFLAFIVGVWVYAEPLSRQAGHGPKVAGTAVSISLACQALGGAAATIFAPRLRWFWVLVACAVIDFGLIALFAGLPGPGLYLAASGLFGFVWLFVMPFLAPMTIEADPSRRAAVLLGGAQLLGGSLGPLMASALVTDLDVRGALSFGAGALALALVLATGLHLRHGKA